ncbi:MAG: molybdenum cofactor biosynthesis protein MoaE [Elusimicrobia bacterium]|nr:molybdenum cofactor biosynthesis protein MoaE [Elusimicrobiota bacterium]
MKPAIHVALRRGRLSAQRLIDLVKAPAHGAVSMFLGDVRDNCEGRKVKAVTYDAFEPLALKALGEIAAEAARRFGASVAIEHRVGRLAVGEASLIIAAGAPHRHGARKACGFALEEIKRRLPVWKREHYNGGDARWLEGRPLKS